MQANEVELKLFRYAKAHDEYGDFKGHDESCIPSETLYGHLRDILDTWRAEEKSIEVSGLGTVSLVQSFGGEGEGDQYYIVLKVDNDDDDITYWRVNGWYASYDGGYLDGDLFQVKPVEKVVIEYESF